VYSKTIKKNIMKNQIEITELTNNVTNANTANVTDRQTIANSCKALYNLIEEDVFNAGCEWMLNGMYRDLCSGNFAEPFMCEQKKLVFTTIVATYNNMILPRL
jgi:hypothetical protein